MATYSAECGKVDRAQRVRDFHQTDRIMCISVFQCHTFSRLRGFCWGRRGSFSIGWALWYYRVTRKGKKTFKLPVTYLSHRRIYTAYIYMPHLYRQHFFFIRQLSSPRVFAACCCTHGRSHGGWDELDITFGEPASLSGLQLTQPPHVLLL